MLVLSGLELLDWGSVDLEMWEVLERAGVLGTRKGGSVYGGPAREGTGVVGPSVDKLEETGEFWTRRDESIFSGPCKGNASVGVDVGSCV